MRIFTRLVPLALAFCMAAALPAATFTVTSTADSGAGSLRKAITDANNAAGADAVRRDQMAAFLYNTFDFP